jgi:hypothetical protein
LHLKFRCVASQFAHRANLPHAISLASRGKSPRPSRASHLDEGGAIV